MLNIDKVSKSFHGKLILDKVSFTLSKGKFTGLIGNNGAGKTTLFKILSGLIGFDSGQITYAGKSIKSLDSWHRNNLGIILSDQILIEEFRVREFVLFTAKFQGLTDAEAKERCEYFLSALSLEDESNKKIRELSTGNKKRVSIVSSLIHDPPTLLYDEPFSGIDIIATERICSLLRGFRADKALLISSHDINTLVEICDEFLFLDENGIIHQPIPKNNFLTVAELINYLKEEKFRI
jgi:ABC-2 type transport system ATP-binding protein